MRHTDIFHIVLKSIENYIWNNIYYLPIFIIFQYIFQSYYYLGDCTSGWCVSNKSKRSCADFCGGTNCENTNPQMKMGEVQDDEWRMWFITGLSKKTQYQINVEVKYILFK